MSHFVKFKMALLKSQLEKTYLKKVLVLITVRGGRGKIFKKCLNYILSQLRVKGGGVNLIETLSEYMQFFFFDGVPNHLKFKKLNYLQSCHG